MNIYIHENMKQVTRIRYKTEDNPPMANVPLIGLRHGDRQGSQRRDKHTSRRS